LFRGLKSQFPVTWRLEYLHRVMMTLCNDDPLQR
jgi:hypothetical protein